MLSTRTGLSPALVHLSMCFRFLHNSHWANPRSLATTSGVSVDFLSSGYLDVSVRQVCLCSLWIQLQIPQCGGFPHSDVFGSKIAPISPKLFAGCHVLHRLLVPRHPPDALITLESPCAGINPTHVSISEKLISCKVLIFWLWSRSFPEPLADQCPLRSLDP